MKQVFFSQGRIVVEDLPIPAPEKGRVLVRNQYSCISAGTELGSLKKSQASFLDKALEKPEYIQKMISKLFSEGFSRTLDAVKDKMNQLLPVGYSSAGTVCEAGADVDGIGPGMRVACAGNQFAYHAEYVSVPRNLIVPIPEALSFERASTVALGAIALQGVRRLSPTLGDTVVVYGLGIIGLLTVQLLKLNGCRVIGIDLIKERADLARRLGAQNAFVPGEPAESEILGSSRNLGADAVIITALGSADDILSRACRLTRKKGKIVIVGDIKLDIERSDLYTKEIDILISTSYGPGRYDPEYEENGRDYPLAYVKWTQNRNMEEYIRVLAAGGIHVDPLLSSTYPVKDASKAYDSFSSSESRPLIVLLTYPGINEIISLGRRTIVTAPAKEKTVPGIIRVGLIGAGSFAKQVHLPNLRRLDSYFQIRAVCGRSSVSAKVLARKYRAAYATTSPEDIFSDSDIDCVFIATRHASHGRLALEALERGKHVFVEKPLAMTSAELEKIKEFFVRNSSGDVPLLMTGFNRRFSPMMLEIRKIFQERTSPMMINYRINAGFLPPDHWVFGKDGGGRNIGEACHIYDLFCYLTQSHCVSAVCECVKDSGGRYQSGDNFAATLKFADGSVAALVYSSSGAALYPKERMDIFCGGKTVFLDNYQTLCVVVDGKRRNISRRQNKGHFEELEFLARALRGERGYSISREDQFEAMKIALAVEDMISQKAGESGQGEAGDQKHDK